MYSVTDGRTDGQTDDIMIPINATDLHVLVNEHIQLVVVVIVAIRVKHCLCHLMKQPQSLVVTAITTTTTTFNFADYNTVLYFKPESGVHVTEITIYHRLFFLLLSFPVIKV